MVNLRNISRLVVCLAPLLLVACATPKTYDYTAFRQSNPHSIVELPPLNNSPDMHATYSVLSTVTQPLAEAGYYVFPVALVDQTFQENGLLNPGEMHQAPLDKIREIFGADAALYITVTNYGPGDIADTEVEIIENQVVVGGLKVQRAVDVHRIREIDVTVGAFVQVEVIEIVAAGILLAVRDEINRVTAFDFDAGNVSFGLRQIGRPIAEHPQAAGDNDSLDAVTSHAGLLEVVN